MSESSDYTVYLYSSANCDACMSQRAVLDRLELEDKISAYLTVSVDNMSAKAISLKNLDFVPFVELYHGNDRIMEFTGFTEYEEISAQILAHQSEHAIMGDDD